VAGTSVLDEFTFSLRFLRLWTILPWLIAGVVVIAAGTYLLIRRVARRRNGAKI
jgi:nitrate reductase gamma subunit